MEKEKLQKWLSIQADAVKTLVDNRDFDEDIRTVVTSEYQQQIHLGARKIANTLGLQLHERSWKAQGATANYISFEYEGVVFFQLEDYEDGES